MARLEPSVTAFVNHVMLDECSHSAADNAGLGGEHTVEGYGEAAFVPVFREPIHACLLCMQREATRFAAQMIAVGRQLERESNDSAASVSRGAQR